MDLPSLIRLCSWFVPIPFMLLYLVKTNKLNKLTPLCLPVAVVSVLTLFLTFSTEWTLGFRPDLISLYVFAVSISFILFRKKYDFPQALSIAICITFFGSLYWEIPIHISTIITKGYLDQALPLHLLFVFPLLFILPKIKPKKDKRNFFLLFFGVGVSVVLLLWTEPMIHSSSFVIFKRGLDHLNRLICLGCLYVIFYREQFRQSLRGDSKV